MTYKKKFNILIISEFDGSNANVIRDYLFSFNKYSIYNYYYIFSPDILTTSFNFRNFHAIVIFWSVYLFGTRLSFDVRLKIAESSAIKIFFVQDEYRMINNLCEILDKLNIDLIFTLAEESLHNVLYPLEKITSLKEVITVLAGYVPQYLEDDPLDILSKRKIDIGYRSRRVPFWLGDLGQEKVIIAEKFLDICAKNGFICDISVEEKSRIYGVNWINFLKSTKFTLGTESGASLCDFSGKIKAEVEKYLTRNPNASYDDVKKLFFKDIDWKVPYTMVSPRIFEAVACGCVLVLHEGKYSEIIKPSVHYISIKKDYSNILEVINSMRNENKCNEMRIRSYQDLIASKRYNYHSFIKKFECVISKYLTGMIKCRGPNKILFYAKNYILHNQRIIPYSYGYLTLPPWFFPFKKIQRLFKKIGISTLSYLYCIFVLSMNNGLKLFFKGTILNCFSYKYPIQFLREYMGFLAVILIIKNKYHYDKKIILNIAIKKLVYEIEIITNIDKESKDFGYDKICNIESFIQDLRKEKICKITWNDYALNGTIFFTFLNGKLTREIDLMSCSQFKIINDLFKRYPLEVKNFLIQTIKD